MRLLKTYQLNEVVEVTGWMNKVYYQNGIKGSGPCYRVNIETNQGNAYFFVDQFEYLYPYFMSAPERVYIQAIIIIKAQSELYGTSCEIFVDTNGQICIKQIEYIEPMMVDIPDLRSRMNQHLISIKNPTYRNLALKICSKEDVKSRLPNVPAGEGGPHSYRGGLLAHIVRLMDIIDQMGVTLSKQLYSEQQTTPIDIDLLKLCAILHDIGKIDAYDMKEGKPTKTFLGQMFQHSYLSAKRLWALLSEFPIDNPDVQILLEQVVTSSQGRLDFGALNVGKTKEALLFHKLEALEGEMAHFELVEINQNGEIGFAKMFKKEVYIRPQFEQYAQIQSQDGNQAIEQNAVNQQHNSVQNNVQHQNQNPPQYENSPNNHEQAYLAYNQPQTFFPGMSTQQRYGMMYN